MRTMLNSKLHRAAITECELNYEGSCSIDTDLLKAADIIPYEKIEIYNINNGQRFSTYAIPADSGTRKIGLNGAAARLGELGDRLIIATYKIVQDEQVVKHKPKVILLDEKNNIIEE